MTVETLKQKPKEEVLSILGNKGGFSSILKNRLVSQVDLKEIPVVDRKDALTQKHPLVFSTGDTSVMVFISRIEEEEAIICVYKDSRPKQISSTNSSDDWGESNNEPIGMDTSSVGLCITEKANQAKSIAVFGSASSKIEYLEVWERNYEKFGFIVDRINRAINDGVASQGKELYSTIRE